MTTLVYLLLAIILVGQGAESICAQAPKRVPVIIELFTSEGCDTCPPADKYLQKLAKDQPIAGVEIIPLQEHVDYFDRLGWKDAFSSAQFTNRQGNFYAPFFKQKEVYTPQLIVDGSYILRGSDGNKPVVQAAGRKKGSVEVKITKTGADLLTAVIKVGDLEISPDDKAVLLIAVTENDLVSKVLAGENKGSTFKHMAVTRYLKSVGPVTTSGGEFAVDVPLGKDWKQNDLNVVAFIQEIQGRRILGAASLSLKK